MSFNYNVGFKTNIRRKKYIMCFAECCIKFCVHLKCHLKFFNKFEEMIMLKFIKWFRKYYIHQMAHNKCVSVYTCSQQNWTFYTNIWPVKNPERRVLKVPSFVHFKLDYRPTVCYSLPLSNCALDLVSGMFALDYFPCRDMQVF